jgi:S1-C subfamily serine protease
MYRLGEGVPEDDKEAVKWYRLAADQGFALAQLSLAFMYEWGEGVPEDFIEAYKWYNLAAAQGLEAVVEFRDKLKTRMTPEQIADGQRRAAAFVPGSGNKPEDLQGESRLEPKVGESALGELAGSGTGFFITPDGWLVTNAHIVQAEGRVTVSVGDKLLSGTVGRVDAGNDLALVRVDGEHAALPIASSRGVPLGATVFTVGFPNPGLQGVSPKMTKGEISSLAGVGDDPRHFQISVPIQPGNSGGAVVDEAGNVVGVVCAKISDLAAIESSGAIPQNINYAVKSSYLLALVESVPDVSRGLVAARGRAGDFQAAVQAAEAATVMVLVFE